MQGVDRQRPAAEGRQRPDAQNGRDHPAAGEDASDRRSSGDREQGHSPRIEPGLVSVEGQHHDHQCGQPDRAGCAPVGTRSTRERLGGASRPPDGERSPDEELRSPDVSAVVRRVGGVGDDEGYRCERDGQGEQLRLHRNGRAATTGATPKPHGEHGEREHEEALLLDRQRPEVLERRRGLEERAVRTFVDDEAPVRDRRDHRHGVADDRVASGGSTDQRGGGDGHQDPQQRHWEQAPRPATPERDEGTLGSALVQTQSGLGGEEPREHEEDRHPGEPALDPIELGVPGEHSQQRETAESVERGEARRAGIRRGIRGRLRRCRSGDGRGRGGWLRQGHGRPSYGS